MLRSAGAGNRSVEGIGCSSQLKLSQMLEMLMERIERDILICREAHLVGGISPSEPRLASHCPLRQLSAAQARYSVFSLSFFVISACWFLSVGGSRSVIMLFP